MAARFGKLQIDDVDAVEKASKAKNAERSTAQWLSAFEAFLVENKLFRRMASLVRTR